jgi:hypothetical protein
MGGHAKEADPHPGRTPRSPRRLAARVARSVCNAARAGQSSAAPTIREHSTGKGSSSSVVSPAPELQRKEHSRPRCSLHAGAAGSRCAARRHECRVAREPVRCRSRQADPAYTPRRTKANRRVNPFTGWHAPDRPGRLLRTHGSARGRARLAETGSGRECSARPYKARSLSARERLRVTPRPRARDEQRTSAQARGSHRWTSTTCGHRTPRECFESRAGRLLSIRVGRFVSCTAEISR